MADAKLCPRCFSGHLVGNTCSKCGNQYRPVRKENTSTLPVGYVLHNQYYIGEVLGQGGFGITYAAWDMKHQRRVAVKELFPSKDVSREIGRYTVHAVEGQKNYFDHVIKCFEDEAKILIKLQNQKGVVHLYHLFRDNNTSYYVMEYLEGKDLRKHLTENGVMTWDAFAPILKTVLQALETLHGEGLIHRDVSPDNIFLTTDGAVRLIDFGSVREYQAVSRFTTVIKHCFAPWEQYSSNGNQGPWTDIYSLCVTTYYALTGKLPPIAPNRRIEDKVIPIQDLVPELPENVARGIMQGMVVLEENRCRSVKELRKLLGLESAGRQPVREEPRRAAPAVGTGSVLVGVSGLNKGCKWKLHPGKSYQIGRSLQADIRYPANTGGVSRNQCTVYAAPDGSVFARDDGSRWGTVLISGRQRVTMVPGQWYRAKGCWLSFGQQECYYFSEGTYAD